MTPFDKTAYQKDYMQKRREQEREREHYEELQATIANYQGRRKEIYDNLMKSVVDGLPFPTLLEKQRANYIAEMNKWFDEEYLKITFNLDDVKLFLQKQNGISWEQLTAEEQAKLTVLFENQFKEIRGPHFEQFRKEKIPEAILRYDIMTLEHTVEGVELKFQLENNSNALDSEIRGAVKKVLWDSLVDDVANKVKKELAK